MQIPVYQKSKVQRIRIRRVTPLENSPTNSIRGLQALKQTIHRRVGRNPLLRRSFRWPIAFVGERRKALFNIGLFIGFMVGYIGVTNGIAYAHQTVRAEHVVNHAVNEPIRVVFSRPVKSGLQYGWQENIKGSWRFEKQLGGVRALVFTPKATLTPNSVLHLRLKKVQPTADIMSNTPSEQIVQVVMERAPRVTAQTPAKKAALVRPNSAVSVRLSGPNKGLRALVLSGDIPVVSPKPSSRDDMLFQWKLSKALDQGKMYHAEVRDTQQSGEKQVVAVFDFTTVAEPRVTTNASGYLGPNQTIILSFDQDMVATANTVQFTMPGKGAWDSKRQYSFTTSLVVPGTTYSYKVSSGTSSVHGGVMTTESVFYAQTPGNVKVASAQPSGARVPLATSLSLTFDQPVDKNSAENAFYIQPKVAGSFSWSGNTMTYRVSGLSEQTTYSYGVAPGIKPVFGLVGIAFDKQFTTVPPIRKLAVPFYRQAHSLSCESASLRMALASYGVMTNDDEILGRVGYSPQPRDTAHEHLARSVPDVRGKCGRQNWCGWLGCLLGSDCHGGSVIWAQRRCDYRRVSRADCYSNSQRKPGSALGRERLGSQRR
ncbi:Ig-like domain-containing protein [Candidatus Saccharibacteria bacterium]|nr:MAG: Ig-like domain-containing protein [Candidatus Saccharibacteria bacterium]